MNSVRSMTAVALSLLCVCLACQEPDTTPDKRSPDIVIANGAENIHYKTHGADEGVSYEVDTPYPANQLLGTIRETLRARGWQAATELALNPGIPTSQRRGWVDYLDSRKQPPQKVDQWIGEWRNAAGDRVTYTLHYEGNRDRAKVWVDLERKSEQ